MLIIANYEPAERIDENHLLCPHCKKIVPHNHNTCVDIVQLESLQETRKLERRQADFNEVLMLGTIVISITALMAFIIQIEPYMENLKPAHIKEDASIKDIIYNSISMIFLITIIIFLLAISVLIYSKFLKIYPQEGSRLNWLIRILIFGMAIIIIIVWFFSKVP
ncbi:hypothetical protein HYW19_02895 [Candidatus Woesearchaeota archaeon]|nr:hypothetical protein [Candidatus Woesearchaeota archaeon]